MTFVVMFEFGPGPIIWIYMSEVMNEKGVAVGTFINWTLTLIVGFGTTYLFNSLKGDTFYVFATTCGIGLIFIIMFVKETKGLTQEDLLNLYRPDRYKLYHRDSTFASDSNNSSSFMSDY
jgi:hypothetical protein